MGGSSERRRATGERRRATSERRRATGGSSERLRRCLFGGSSETAVRASATVPVRRFERTPATIMDSVFEFGAGSDALMCCGGLQNMADLREKEDYEEELLDYNDEEDKALEDKALDYNKVNGEAGKKYNLLRKKFPATSFTGSPVLSDAGFNLLNKLLTYDPDKRITAEAALNHDWFREVPLPKSKDFMPTFPAQHAQDRRMRRVMKSPDPLEELRRRELQQGADLGNMGLFG